MGDSVKEKRLTQKEFFAQAKQLSTADQFCLIRNFLDHLCPDGKGDLNAYQEETIRSLKKLSLEFSSQNERETAELALLQEKLKQFKI